MSQKKSSPDLQPAVDRTSFEQNLADLEQLVEQLESGQLELAESLQRFRQGVELGRQCREMLDEAQQVIEQVVSQSADREPDPATTRTTESGETSG